MSFVSDFFDDVVGLDPSGGGLYDATRAFGDSVDPVGVIYSSVTGNNLYDDVFGMDPNGGGAISTGNAVAPLIAAYFTGAYGGDLLGGASAATDAASTDSAMAALADAGITSSADVSAFDSALANSDWGSVLSSYTPADYSLAGGTLGGSGIGLSTGGSGLGMTGGLDAAGGFIGGGGLGLQGVLDPLSDYGFSGVGGALGINSGSSLLDGLMNKNTLTNLGKAWKAFQSQGQNGQRSPSEVAGFMNTLQTLALMGQALQGRNGIDSSVLQTHDLVAPKGPNFAAATQKRMSRKFKGGGRIPGALELVSLPASHHENPGGQDDVVSINAAPGEYVFDADTVAALGDGNTETGARKLDDMRYNIRKHKRSAPPDKIPPKSRPIHQYLEGKK